MTPRDDNEQRRKMREYKRMYRAKKRSDDPEYAEWVKSKASEYYYKNRDQVRAKVNAKNAADPTKAQASGHNGRVKRVYPEAWTTTNITNKSLRDWIVQHRGCDCPYCGGESVHIDHRIPLAKGGSHTFTNLQMICKICNVAKSDMTETEFLEWASRLPKISYFELSAS